VKKLNKNSKKKFDSRKGVLLASYTKKKTRRKKGKTGKDGANNYDSNGNDQVKIFKYLFINSQRMKMIFQESKFNGNTKC